MDNKFERASRGKLRFTTNRGQLLTEDLWDLKLEDLDNLAINLNKQVKEKEENSFITTTRKTKAVEDIELRFDIVKHIIDVKLSEKAAAENKKLVNAKREKLEELLDAKRNEALASKSIEEIEAELKALEG